MVCGNQDPRVVVEARPHAEAGLGTIGHVLRGGQRFRVLLEALDAEKFRANGLV
jgi:hypothetical protein